MQNTSLNQKENNRKKLYPILLMAPMILIGFVIAILIEMASRFAHRAVIRLFTRPALKK